MVYLFLADGFEIIEAMAPIDMLRRAKLDITTVGVSGKTIKSSCGIEVNSDITIDEFTGEDIECVILPGGMPGTLNLEANARVQTAIDNAVEKDKLVCAICAAPSILGHKSLLKGKEAICYPGFEESLSGATVSEKYVVKDGNFITAKGAGVAVDFSLEIVKALTDEETALSIRNSIQCL